MTWASSSTPTWLCADVCQTVSRCFAALRQLRSIRHLVSATVFQSLVNALVLRRLDYGNRTLIGLPIHLIRRLQSVQTDISSPPLSTCGSLHQSLTSRPDKDFGLPPRTICAFLPPDCLLLDVVLSVSPVLVFGTLFLPTSLQHLLCSLSENV